MLANVLANAVKFTTAGEVVVCATCRDAEPGGPAACSDACSGADAGGGRHGGDGQVLAAPRPTEAFIP